MKEKGMKRLVMFVVAGMMGLLLAACGDNAPKPATTPDAAVEQSAPAASEAAPEATTSDATTDQAAEDAKTAE